MVSFGVKSVQDICRCIETGDKPLCSGDDGRAALEIALALRHSQRTGNCRMDLPFTDPHAAIYSA
jgi:predicted dehydrogenase